ncbi:E3 ubiquitin-protein ligase RFI2-like isoform X3 [Papaver somniferum]|uniref:E3 ubiquitin-protein ligase RFI2-like isoform X3 n=1 Tax=Papaver somniferum TaxID=3469 RepID=UPI000E6FB128|nr:E3 ubiquitin-protein ligase RFI2-like isoform X3 [Papaver somniferum]
MGLGGGGGGTDLMVDEGSGGEEMLDNSSSSVSCSICLDEVLNKRGDRSRAILQCGHEFHLDCIGSMFNSKGGVMQCPNCRKTEKGQWQFTHGSHSSSFSEFNLVDWAHDDDLYDLTYSEMPYGVHWCPFRGLTPISSSYEDRESPTTIFHDLLGHNAVLAERAAVSSGDIHYQVWDHHSPPYSATSSHLGAADQGSIPSAAIRPSRGDSDSPPRSGSVHPFFVDQGSGSRAGTSIMPSMVPPYAGVSSRVHDRVEGVHQLQQQPQFHPRAPMFSNVRRSNGPRGAPPVTQPPSSSEHGGNFYVLPPSGSSGRNLQETVNPSHSHFYAWERDRFAPFPLVPVDRELSWWPPPHLAAGGSEPGIRANGHWHRHGSERTSSQGRRPHPHPPGQMHPFNR